MIKIIRNNIEFISILIYNIYYKSGRLNSVEYLDSIIYS